MRRRHVVVGLPAAVAVGGLPAQAQSPAVPESAPKPSTLTIVHLNDVYEIVAGDGGKSGGLARVATVIKELEASSPPVLVTLGGDYLSPSALGTAIVDGERLAGRQMVDVLNAVGVDWATLGNHEFDVSEARFRQHIPQARFKLVSNVTDADGQPFPGIPLSAIVPITAGSRTMRVGLVGVTIDATRKDWVRYPDGIVAAKAEVARLRGKVDAIVALTHLPLDSDAEFAAAVPGVDLILGGHEHENWLVQRGPRFVPIVKADANARTLAVVTMTLGTAGTPPQVASRLLVVDERVTPDPDVDAIARRWVERAYEGFRREGFDPDAVVAITPEPLDGREATVRNRAGRLTDLIVAAIAHDAGTIDVAIFNGGSVRIDDVLPPGRITEYDIIRILPFGGRAAKAQLEGALLARVLDTGVNNEGTGGYLHAWGVRREGATWIVGGKPIAPARRYVVALPGFLLTGGEANLGFLTPANPQVRDVQELRDIRFAVIAELKRLYPSK